MHKTRVLYAHVTPTLTDFKETTLPTPRSVRQLLSALEDSLGQLEELDSEFIDESILDPAVAAVEAATKSAAEDQAANTPDEDSDDEDEDEDEDEG